MRFFFGIRDQRLFEDSIMRNMHITFCLIVSLLVLALAGCDRAFYVFKDNKPMASIHVPKDASDDMKKAVEAFREDVRRGYGVDIPVDSATNLPGRIELAIQERSLETEDETVIDFPAGNVMRVTGGESGVMRALFRLLEERAGVRYLYQGKHGTWFPPATELAIPRKTLKLASFFPLTRCSPQTTYQTRKFWWGWEVRLGTKERVHYQHDLSKIAFPMKAYRGTGPKPDERIFPVQKGVRFLPYEQPEIYNNNLWQPCYSSQTSIEEAVKNILAYLKENPRTKSLSLAVNDGGGFCECEECLKLDQGGKACNSMGYQHRSASYYRWLNEVVGRVSGQFPDVVFGCLAYSNVLDPPAFNLHPNIVPFLCFDIMACIDPKIMADRKKLIRDWSEKAGRLGFWGYELGDLAFTLPRINFTEKQEMLRYLRDCGGVAAMAERSYFTANEGPKMYLFFKLLENPDLDLESTLNNWCAAAVGREAAPYLRQYYGFWEEFWRTQAVKTPWWQSRHAVYLALQTFGTYMYALNPGDMAHCRQLMEKVLDLAGRHGTPDQAERAKLLMRCFEWYEAAADACGAEILSPDGTLPDAASAAALLRRIPRAQQSFEKWMTIPEKTEDWYAYRLIVDAGKGNNVVVGTLSPVLEFLPDPEIQAELKKISADGQCSATIRFVAANMLKGASGDNTGNLVENGSFENGGDDGWTPSHPIHGKVGGVDGIAGGGTRSLKCDIQHGNFTATKAVLNARPDTGYYFAARIFIPTNQPPGLILEGRLQFWGNTTRENGAINCAVSASRPEMRLDPGKWNYVCAIVPGHPKADSVRLCVRLFNFENGAAAYIDDVQLFEMPPEGAMVKSAAR